MLLALACFLLLCVSAGLYLVIRGIGGMREVFLETEEHGLLLELGSEVLGGRAAPLWQEYEQARWLQRLQHWQRLSRFMQFLLHANFWRGAREERHASTRYSRLLQAQMRCELERALPQEMAALSKSPDQQLATRKLARLLTLGCYARLWRTWEEGRQQMRQAADKATCEQLDRMFATLVHGEPMSAVEPNHS